MLLYTTLMVWNEEHVQFETLSRGWVLLFCLKGKMWQRRLNSDKIRREEETCTDWDHNLEFNAPCHEGTQGHVLCDTQAHQPQAAKHEQVPLLSLPTDKSCSWAGKHLNLNHRTWAAIILSPPLCSLFLDQRYGCSCLFHKHQCQRDGQNLEPTQNESSACTKATLILLNSSAWSTAPSPLINSGSLLRSLRIADTVNVWVACTARRPLCMHAAL